LPLFFALLLYPRLVAQDAITIEDFPYQPEGETEEQVVYQKVSVNALPMEAELVPTTDMRYLSPSLQLFAQRHDPAANVEELDREIADKFKSNFTALMYSLDLETGAHLYGATQSIVLKSISLSIIRPIFLKYHAIELEDELFIFYEPADAVNAALDAKDAVQHYNQQLTSEHEKNRLNVVGWGIHVGTMIFVEGTDIHWGDPVNTASKLGQDLATDGDLLLSSAVMAIAKEHHKLCETGSKKVIFEERKLKRSGVDFLAYCASRVGDEGESAV
jgi:class 3 adenylate cyclase|tara:strand:- start:91 stop:912 length:822 start_codon:yes stop_codon:yes gene_type:complete